MRRQSTQSQHTATGMHRVLVPVDFTDASIQAVECGAKLARSLGTTLTLLHVVEVDRSKKVPENLREQSLKEIREVAEKKLQNFFRLFVGNGVASEIVVGIGKPVQQILYEIREMNPDLVVMTSRHRQAMRWFWQRDTTMEILEQAPCPVLVLHDTGTDCGDLLFY